ncbi:MAG: prepilin peptidase [Lachnospiraceae bacterium]
MKKWRVVMTVGVIFMLALGYFYRYGTTLLTIRCFLISLIWLIAAHCDAATYEIPDYIHVLLILAGLIEIQWLSALLGLCLVALPFFVTALVTDGKIGGGDVKLMGASGFAIGVTKGFEMLLWGLLFAVLWQRVLEKRQHSLPLAPFLGAGGILMLLCS